MYQVSELSIHVRNGMFGLSAYLAALANPIPDVAPAARSEWMVQVSKVICLFGKIEYCVLPKLGQFTSEANWLKSNGALNSKTI